MSDPNIPPASAATATEAAPHRGARSAAARIQRWSLWIALGTIAIGAILAIVWLLSSTSGGVIGRAFLTLAVLVAFAFAVLGEVTLVDRRHAAVTLIRLLILAATVGSAIWLIWGDDHGWWRYSEGWSKAFGWFAVVAALQAAGGLVSLAGWWVASRRPRAAWSATMLAGSVLALGAFVMLAIPCTFQELRPDDFYWRLVAAFGIAAAACVIVPLTAIAMTRPKAPRPPRPTAEGTAWPEPALPGAANASAPLEYQAPGYPPAAYPPAPYYPGVPVQPAPRHSALSIVGFVLAILIAPVGLVISIVALVQARRQQHSTGFGLAGVIIGGAITAFWTLIIVAIVGSAIEDQARQEARNAADAAAKDRIASLVSTAVPQTDTAIDVYGGLATIRLGTPPDAVTVHDYATIVHEVAGAFQDQDTRSSENPLWAFTIEACRDGLNDCRADIAAFDALMTLPGWGDASYGSSYFESGDYRALAGLSVPPVGTPTTGPEPSAPTAPGDPAPALHG